MKKIRVVRNVVLGALALVMAVSALLTAVHFPYDTNSTVDKSGVTVPYYTDVYSPKSGDTERDAATLNADAVVWRIPEQTRAFVEACRLEDKRVLEIGAGAGLLQDIVNDYTALEIAPSARRFFHKPFIVGSATAMPFPDSVFDGVWSIWVLEHIANPETALNEMRRVVKNNGYIYLQPAWDVGPWAAKGLRVRPYSDFDWGDKLVKLSLPLQQSRWYRSFYVRPIRLARSLTYHLGDTPSRLHFRSLTPNYSKYWEPDSDAVTSLDKYEALLWFTSRGDLVLNCSESTLLFKRSSSCPDGLVVQVHK